MGLVRCSLKISSRMSHISVYACLLYPAPRAAGNFVPGFGPGRLNRDSTLKLGSPTGSASSMQALGPSTYPSVENLGEKTSPTEMPQQVPGVAHQGVSELPKENVETSSVGHGGGDKTDGSPSPVPTAGSKGDGTPSVPTTPGGNVSGIQNRPASTNGNVGVTETAKEKENDEITGNGTPPLVSGPATTTTTTTTTKPPEKDQTVLPKGSGGEKKKEKTHGVGNKAPASPVEPPDGDNKNMYDNGFYWKTLNSN